MGKFGANTIGDFFGKDDVGLQLETKSRQLQKTWERFNAKLKIQEAEKPTLPSKPDINAVRQTIEDATTKLQKAQETKFGKTNVFFTRAVQNLDSYSYLFDLLLSGDRKLSAYVDRFKNEEARENAMVTNRLLWNLGEKMNAVLLETATVKAQLRKCQTTGSGPLSPSIGSRTIEQALPDVIGALEHHLQDNSVTESFLEQSRILSVGIEVAARVRLWATQTSSEALWIEGPYGIPIPSRSTLTAAFVLKNLRAIGQNLMDINTESNDRETTNFSPTRFSKLTGNVADMVEAVKLLMGLIAEDPPLQFCIIDGLQLLDDQSLHESARKSLNEFV
ncbi:MAG: hypothetical protein Q9160_002146 [Pyrenula sp. 1 TL-2023]